MNRKVYRIEPPPGGALLPAEGAAAGGGGPEVGPEPGEAESVAARDGVAAGSITGPAASAAAFRPRIVVFACNWCSYAGADFAGVSRMQYPPDVRLIRLMCSGRVHPGLVIKAFEAGADGVMVSGCHPGDCHYAFGNLRAAETVDRIERLLHLLGVDPRRFRLEWFTAAEGQKFARVVGELVEAVQAAGPNPYAAQRARPPSGMLSEAVAAIE